MFNPETKLSKKISIDVDSHDIREVNKRLDYAVSNWLYNIEKILVYQSSMKGYSIKIRFRLPMLVAKVRKELRDDGFRLMSDILRSHKSHDILWQRKVINGVKFDHHLIKVYILTITNTNYVKIRRKEMSNMRYHGKRKDGNCTCFWLEENEGSDIQKNNHPSSVILQEGQGNKTK